MRLKTYRLTYNRVVLTIDNGKLFLALRKLRQSKAAVLNKISVTFLRK